MSLGKARLLNESEIDMESNFLKLRLPPVLTAGLLGILLVSQFLFGSVAASAPLCIDIFKPKATSSVGLGLGASFNRLVSRNFLLTQNAKFLPAEACGGTCNSVTATNSMMALAEAIKPGSVLSRGLRMGLFRASGQALARRILQDLLATLRKKHNHDGTRGATHEQIAKVYREVFERHFGTLSVPVHFRSIGPKMLQSVQVGANTLLHGTITHTNMKGRRHAVVIHEIKPTPEEFRKGRDGELTFVISDPHNPNQLKEIHVFESSSRMVSSDGYEFVEGLAINFGTVTKAKEWTAGDLLNVLNGEYSKRVNITLIDGTVLHEVKLLQPHSDKDTWFDIAQRFYLLDTFDINQIAQIQTLE